VVTAYLNGVATYTNTITTDITAQSGVYIGSYQPNASAIYEYQGYLQDLRIYKGVAKYKGGFDVPRPYTPVGIATWRAVPDSPANNFATLNAVQNSMSLTDGNLTCTGTGSNQEVYSTIGITTGKWYVEARTNVGTHNHFGVRANSTATYATDYRLIARDDGNVYGDTSQGQVGTLSSGYASAGNIVAMAIDGNLGQITYYVNGVNVGGPYSIYQYNSSSLPTPYKIYNLANSGDSLTVNFGQNPSFSGNIGNFAFKIAKIYSTFNGSVRSANYTVQYSDDNVNWTTAWTGVATNNTSCGIQVNSGGGGNYGAHRYWRYVEGSPVDSHHPRVSRIILSDGITDVNIVTYTSDNCSDTGEYVIGTVTYDGKNGAGTFTDSNGKGLFKYQPPSGFLALCEDNLPTPAISDPGKHFKTVLWTGDGNSGRSIVGVGFQPDFVWIKSRTQTYNHRVFDTVRGAGKDNFLLPNSTAVEGASSDYYGGISSFNADGFSMVYGTGGSNIGINESGANYVAWCWKAGAGTTSTNTNGSITSVVSVNQDAGFSIVSYTGNGTIGATVGHGLNKTVKFMITKSRNTTDNWVVHTNVTGTQTFSFLNLTNGGTTDSVAAPTSSVFYRGSANTINGSGLPYIAYCWAEIEGFSKFGSYTGNGSADGPFIYTGGRPAFVMIKRTDSTQNWPIIDSSRDSVNVANRRLFANLSDIEDQGIPNFVDILSNGFKCRDSNVSYNASGGTYIFACWMESPFTTANSK
jgi:hypothetical protein